MYISRKILTLVIAGVLLFGTIFGVALSHNSGRNALAEEHIEVDEETLSDLYEAIFGRELDDGAKFHLGRGLKQVLRDIINSDERRYYAALFKAVKAYEEALRAPGELSEEDKDAYLELIDSALANLIAWIETLPDQDICDATTGPEHARSVIIRNYDRLNANARIKAERENTDEYKRRIDERTTLSPGGSIDSSGGRMMSPNNP